MERSRWKKKKPTLRCPHHFFSQPRDPPQSHSHHSLQPVAETRARQSELWRSLILAFCRQEKVRGCGCAEMAARAFWRQRDQHPPFIPIPPSNRAQVFFLTPDAADDTPLFWNKAIDREQGEQRDREMCACACLAHTHTLPPIHPHSLSLSLSALLFSSRRPPQRGSPGRLPGGHGDGGPGTEKSVGSALPSASLSPHARTPVSPSHLFSSSLSASPSRHSGWTAPRPGPWSCGARWRPGRTPLLPGPGRRAWRARWSRWTSWPRRRGGGQVRGEERGWKGVVRAPRALSRRPSHTLISLSPKHFRAGGPPPGAAGGGGQAAGRAGRGQVRLSFWRGREGRGWVGHHNLAFESHFHFLPFLSPGCSRGRPPTTWASNFFELGGSVIEERERARGAISHNTQAGP